MTLQIWITSEVYQHCEKNWELHELRGLYMNLDRPLSPFISRCLSSQSFFDSAMHCSCQVIEKDSACRFWKQGRSAFQSFVRIIFRLRMNSASRTCFDFRLRGTPI